MSDANATHKIVIPLFDPDKNDVTAKTWMAFVSMAIKAAGTRTEGAGEAARQVNNWTESMAANHAILTLRGGASRWIETLIEEENPAVNSWTELQKLFKARFCEKHTLSEKVKLMDLRQGAKESVMDFYDKVKSNVHQWYSEDWVEANTDADKAAKTKSLQMHVKLSFAAGLRPSIQKDTIIQDCNMVEELITVAMRVEALKRITVTLMSMPSKLKELNKKNMLKKLSWRLMKMVVPWLLLMLATELGPSFPVVLLPMDREIQDLPHQQQSSKVPATTVSRNTTNISIVSSVKMMREEEFSVRMSMLPLVKLHPSRVSLRCHPLRWTTI